MGGRKRNEKGVGAGWRTGKYNREKKGGTFLSYLRIDSFTNIRSSSDRHNKYSNEYSAIKYLRNALKVLLTFSVFINDLQVEVQASVNFFLVQYFFLQIQQLYSIPAERNLLHSISVVHPEVHNREGHLVRFLHKKEP